MICQVPCWALVVVVEVMLMCCRWAVVVSKFCMICVAYFSELASLKKPPGPRFFFSPTIKLKNNTRMIEPICFANMCQLSLQPPLYNQARIILAASRVHGMRYPKHSKTSRRLRLSKSEHQRLKILRWIFGSQKYSKPHPRALQSRPWPLSLWIHHSGKLSKSNFALYSDHWHTSFKSSAFSSFRNPEA